MLETIYGIKGKNIHFDTISQASSVKLTFYPLHFTSLLNLTKILHTLHKLHTHDNCNQNWTKDIYTIEESNVKKKIKPKAYQTWNNVEYTCSKSAAKATNQYKQMKK